MLPFLLLPLIIAVLRKYSLRPLLRAWDLLPLASVELVHIFFQLSSWLGNTYWVRFSSYLQWAFMLALLVPILRRKLYVPALWGAGLTVTGSLVNRLVISANGGVMPVFPTLSAQTGYCTPQILASGVDSLHVMMDSGTKLKFLCDWIDLGFCILSPGDVLNHLFVSIVIYCTVRAANATPVADTPEKGELG